MTSVAVGVAKASERIGVQLMIVQAVLFAAENAAIHQIGGHLSLAFIAFLRAAGGLVVVLVLARELGLGVIRTRQLGLQLLRGSASALYLWVLVYSFSHLPFADATAISYTQAAYIAMFSALILGESVSALRWGGTVVGLVGALLISRPSFAAWNPVYLVALVGTALNGLAFVLTKYMQREDSELTTMFYTNLVPVLLNLPIVAMGDVPSLEVAVWPAAVFFLGPLGMYAGIVALKYADASSLGPYTLLRLVIAVIAAVVVFHEPPAIESVLGAGLILASCLLSVDGAPGRIRRLFPTFRRPNASKLALESRHRSRG
jgi:drug/metabolite transporter (DMT)-like permease